MGLGAFADKGLGEARDEAAVLRSEVRRGKDPMGDREAVAAERKPRVRVPSFAECAESYIEAHRSGWKNDKHADQWPGTIRMHVNPVIGELAVDRVGVEDVLKVLQPIWTSHPETASRVRGRIEKILGWAAAMGYRSGDNPAQWNGGALSHLLPPISKIRTIEHHSAVPYSEVPALVAKLRQNGSISAKALIFTILTAARTSEVTGATWDEIDLGSKLWVIPAVRMKAGREHRVPLAPQAIAILEGLTRDRDILFAGSRPKKGLSNMAMLQLLRGIRTDAATVHGFRSSFSTWAREQTDFPREIVESSLAHSSGDAVELAYLRTDFIDKRRQLMEQWAGYCWGR
jgi:integrase